MTRWPGTLLLSIALAGCAQPKGRGLLDEDASFKIPAIKEAAEQSDADAIPQLVAALEDDDAAVRFYAIEALRRLTGQTFDYHFYDDEPDRQPAVARWKSWLGERGER
jgi:HEAT repeat protein